MEYLICRIFETFCGVELLGKKGKKVLGGEEMKENFALNTKPAAPVVLRFRK